MKEVRQGTLSDAGKELAHGKVRTGAADGTSLRRSVGGKRLSLGGGSFLMGSRPSFGVDPADAGVLSLDGGCDQADCSSTCRTKAASAIA